MASQPVPLVTEGECVGFKGKTCLVNSITSRLGWNQFHLVDIDTGHNCVAARYQLERILFLDTDLADDIFEADVVVEETEEDVVGTDLVDERPVGPAQLWSNHTDDDLVRLQENRRFKSTSQQTKWAQKVFQVTLTWRGSRIRYFRVSPLLPITIQCLT